MKKGLFIMESKLTTNYTLVDQYDEKPQKKVDVKVECSNGSIYIMPEGYGDGSTEDGSGCPLMVEIWEGQLRIVAWADINVEDPTHIISLNGAREDLRAESYLKTGLIKNSTLDENILDELRRVKIDEIWETVDLGLDKMGWGYADDSGWEHIMPSNEYSRVFFYYEHPDTDEPSKSATFTVQFKDGSAEVESAEPTF